MWLSNLKGIIFDVHRTLVDDSGFPRDKICRLLRQSGVNLDMPAYFQCYDDLTKKYFNWSLIDPFITIREIHRRRLTEIYQRYQVDRDIEADLNFLWDCIGSSKIYPDASEVLKKLWKKYELAILTNADENDPLLAKLKQAGYQFNTIVTSFQLKKYKPDAELFYYVLEKMKLKKEEAVMVGDSPSSDIVGAVNAGIKIIWINRRQVQLADLYPKPDFQISNLNGLLEIVNI